MLNSSSKLSRAGARLFHPFLYRRAVENEYSDKVYNLAARIKLAKWFSASEELFELPITWRSLSFKNRAALKLAIAMTLLSKSGLFLPEKEVLSVYIHGRCRDTESSRDGDFTCFHYNKTDYLFKEPLVLVK
ncbi:MAG TPA: hypothetical protein VMT55_05710 [Candidatus Sulfotelmatobacter sp.]|nr:hypothetical protein [Candidatus Sulfotelmatobacter sp.]